MKKYFIFALLILTLTVNLCAFKMNNWILEGFGSFFEGEFENLEIDEFGNLSLSYPINEITSLFEVQGWNVEYQNNHLYIGTSSPAHFLKYNISFKTLDTLLSFEAGGFFSTCIDNSNIYTALSPQGIIYKINNSFSDTLFYRESLVVWDMIRLPGNSLAIATADEGKIFILNSNSGEILDSFLTQEIAITSLAYRNDTLYAGSQGKGLLFSIDLSTKNIFVIHDPYGDEVMSLFLYQDNLLYCSNSGIVDISAVYSLSTTVDLYSDYSYSSSEISSNIYSYSNGKAEYLWQSPDPPITGFFLLPDDKIGIIGSPEGNIYSIDLNNNILSFFRNIDYSLIISSVKGSGLNNYLLSLSPPKIFEIAEIKATQGIYLSPILQTNFNSIIGNLIWRSKGNIIMKARVGNTSEPDNFWTPWSQPSQNNEGSLFELPFSNYFQFQAIFNLSEIEPVLTKTELLYSTQNGKPILNNINIYAPGVSNASLSIKGVMVNSFSNELQQWCIISGWNIPESPATIPFPWQGFSWDAADIDNDSLIYDIYIKKDIDDNWIVVKKELKETNYAFNSLYFEEGFYQIKIIVSDKLSNIANESYNDTIVSEIFLVDHTAPEVSGLKNINHLISFNAHDAMSRITECKFSLDGEEWHYIYPDDGVYDRDNEYFSIDVDNDFEGTFRILVYDRYHNAKYSFIEI